MTSGRIIFLNGTSSSGKSSIARELLDILDDGVFFHLAVDSFNAMRSKRELGTEDAGQSATADVDPGIVAEVQRPP
jgi:chloramphenicol 3-O phosphotransferase